MKLPTLGSSVKQVVQQVTAQASPKAPAMPKPAPKRVTDAFEARRPLPGPALTPGSVAAEVRADAKTFRVGVGQAIDALPRPPKAARRHHHRRPRTHASRRLVTAQRRRRRSSKKLGALVKGQRKHLPARRKRLHTRRSRRHHSTSLAKKVTTPVKQAVKEIKSHLPHLKP